MLAGSYYTPIVIHPSPKPFVILGPNVHLFLARWELHASHHHLHAPTDVGGSKFQQVDRQSVERLGLLLRRCYIGGLHEIRT